MTQPGQDIVPATQRDARPTPNSRPRINGRFIADANQPERDAEAARLRSRSMSYRAIGKALGVDASTAFDMVKRAMAEVRREAGEAVVALELEKLDRAEAAVLAVLEARHVTVSNGKVIYLNGADEPLVDDAPVIAAAMALVRISESRRKLIGADAAVKSEVEAQVKFVFEGVNTDAV